MGFFIAFFHLALLILLWKWLASIQSAPSWAPLAGLTALVAVFLAWGWAFPGLLVFYLLLSTLVAWLWLAWDHAWWGRGLVWLVQVAFIGLGVWYELAPYPLWQQIEAGTHWASLAVFGLLPAVGMLMVVRLGQEVVFPPQAGPGEANEARSPTRGWTLHRWLYLAIVVLTLLYLGRFAWRESVLDRLQVEGMSLLLGTNIFIIGLELCALMFWRQAGARFALGVGLVFLVMVAGTLGSSGMIADGRAAEMTEAGGAKIAAALEGYHAQHGRYPPTLDELSPQFVLGLPRMWMAREQGWCYQAGEGYYRLGYIDSPGYRPPATSDPVRLVAQAGEPPGEEWECQRGLEQVQENEPAFSGGYDLEHKAGRD